MIFTRKILWQQPGGLSPKKNPHVEELISRYPVLKPIQASVESMIETLIQCYEADGKLLVAGNGGSCADAEHIVGELMKGFIKKRKVPDDLAQKLAGADSIRGPELAAKLQGGLPAIALHNHPGLSTAFANDVDANYSYAQQVYGYGRSQDVFLGISTSGNAENVMLAAVTARALGMKVLGLTGKDGGRLGKFADTAVIVPEQETYKIQELHLPVYHAVCLSLEESFF